MYRVKRELSFTLRPLPQCEMFAILTVMMMSSPLLTTFTPLQETHMHHNSWTKCWRWSWMVLKNKCALLSEKDSFHLRP